MVETAEERRARRRKWYVANREREQARNREWASAHPEERRAARKRAYWNNRENALRQVRSWRLRTLYGLTEQEWDQKFEDQSGCCAICQQAFVKTPHVDHDHATGKARGLLCSGCNVLVGFLESNNREAAEAYLLCWKKDPDEVDPAEDVW